MSANRLFCAGVTLSAGKPSLVVIVPAYNEADGLGLFHGRLAAVMQRLGYPWSVLYINDGSIDGTLAGLELLGRTDSHVGWLNLARNFGKEAAITAGLDHADADAVIVLDADLQDPPELIADMVDQWQAGHDIVYAQRAARHGDSWFKRMTASAFYRLMTRVGDMPMPRDTGDFRLMSRRVVAALCQLRERHRFMKGLFAWVGFPSVAIRYDRAPRAAGHSKWSTWRLWNLALEGITGFTTMPLRLATYLGVAVAFAAAVFGAQLILRTLIFGNPVSGYPSLMTVVLFLGGVQLITLGVIGEYLGRIFDETKQRPLYLIERAIIAQPAVDDEL